MFVHHFRWRPEVIHKQPINAKSPNNSYKQILQNVQTIMEIWFWEYQWRNKKKLKAEIDNWCPPEVDISNTIILKKRTILLRVTRKILIAFQTLSKKWRFLRHLQVL